MAFKIYTKTGDAGETGLFGGARLPKNHIRIEAYGTVDELNSFLGLVRDHLQEEQIRKVLKDIQDRLFTIGAALATAPGKASAAPDITDADIKLLETEMDRMESHLEPLKNFILPGGHPAVSYAHVARSVCRRAERMVVALHQNEPVNELLLKYLNRLSDYCFMLARYIAKELDVKEVIWTSRK